MTDKNQSNQNIADNTSILWCKELQANGASWVQNQHFWLMGSISFYEQRKGSVFEDARQKQLRFLFNALDRELLPRKFTHTDVKKNKKLKEAYNKRQDRERHNAKFRLERVVYDETGANRDFPHVHFFIKGIAKRGRLKCVQTELIKNTMTELWQHHYTKFGTIDFKPNSNSLWQTGYGYKEDTGTFNNTCSFLLN